MTEILGKPVGRKAKPFRLTYHDSLPPYPYTTTFYVREDASESACIELIEALGGLTCCVLAQYTIGYQKYIVPDWEQAAREIKPGTMGTFKWVVKYRSGSGLTLRSHSIPGRDIRVSLGARYPQIGKRGKQPDPDHPAWIRFLGVFRSVCVSPEGDAIPEHVELDFSGSNWPPKGWKKKYH